MATYSCNKCDMAVNATCAHCDSPLVNDSLTKADGSAVQISQCPDGHGKIKSPMCLFALTPLRTFPRGPQMNRQMKRANAALHHHDS